MTLLITIRQKAHVINYRVLNALEAALNFVLTYTILFVGIVFALFAFGVISQIPASADATNKANILIGLTVIISISFARLCFAYDGEEEVKKKMKKIGSLFTKASVNFSIFFLLLLPFAAGWLPLSPTEDVSYWLSVALFVTAITVGFLGAAYFLEAIIKTWLGLLSEPNVGENREKFSEF